MQGLFPGTSRTHFTHEGISRREKSSIVSTQSDNPIRLLNGCLLLLLFGRRNLSHEAFTLNFRGNVPGRSRKYQMLIDPCDYIMESIVHTKGLWSTVLD